ncbi:MAG: tripartite tricarboxylate transporter permease [Bacillota bacterium]|nr:tripartite tricarboxylate transporter permease [Bacillota bacterium]
MCGRTSTRASFRSHAGASCCHFRGSERSSAAAKPKGSGGVVLGLLVATVGADPQTGVPRLTFGSADLVSGFELVPALVGLFAFGEVFRELSHGIDQYAGTGRVGNSARTSSLTK